jgi:hypothetical protein
LTRCRRNVSWSSKHDEQTHVCEALCILDVQNLVRSRRGALVEFTLRIGAKRRGEHIRGFGDVDQVQLN